MKFPSHSKFQEIERWSSPFDGSAEAAASAQRRPSVMGFKGSWDAPIVFRPPGNLRSLNIPGNNYRLDSICPTGVGKVAGMKIEIDDEKLVRGSEVTGGFGKATLVRQADGWSQWKGGSAEERLWAQEWIKLLRHETVAGCGKTGNNAIISAPGRPACAFARVRSAIRFFSCIHNPVSPMLRATRTERRESSPQNNLHL